MVLLICIVRRFKKMRSILSKKRGMLGLDTVKGFMLLLMVIAVIAFAIIIAMQTLSDTNVLTAGSYGDNMTTNVLNNVSSGVAGFFANTSIWFTLLSVVIIILIIAVVIYAVNRFSESRGTEGL